MYNILGSLMDKTLSLFLLGVICCNVECAVSFDNNSVQQASDLIDVSNVTIVHNDRQYTGLMWFAYNGFAQEILAFFYKYIDSGSCINLCKQNENGMTALMFAALKGHLRCLELLRAECRIKNDNGQTALMLAAANGHRECIHPLILAEQRLVDKCDNTALMYAAWYGRVDCVDLLLDYEYDLQNNTGDTALMVAAYKNHPQCIKRLLHKECGQKNHIGITALMYASALGYVRCVRLLISEADILYEGCTALMIAAAHGYKNV